MKLIFSATILSLLLANHTVASNDALTSTSDISLNNLQKSTSSPSTSHITQGLFHTDTPEEKRHKYLKEAFGHKNTEKPDETHRRLTKALPEIWIAPPQTNETPEKFTQRLYDTLQRIDYKLIIDNVTRLKKDNLNKFDFKGCDFSHANLQGMSLECLNLSRASFKGANLRRANLTFTDLTGADFREALMRDPGIDQTRDTLLTSARFIRANLEEVTLPRIMSCVSFYQANFKRVDASSSLFMTCNMTRADLTEANLSQARLKDVTLTGATMIDAITTGLSREGSTLFPNERNNVAPAPASSSSTPNKPTPKPTGWHVAPRTAGIVTALSFVSGALTTAWMLL